MKAKFITLSLLMATSFAFAADWSYEEGSETNTKDELNLQFKNYSIDTSAGPLTVTGNVTSYGASGLLNITGSNALNIGGTFANQYGDVVLTNAVLNSTGKIINQYGSDFIVKGVSSQTGAGNLEFQQSSTLTVTEGSSFTASSSIAMYWSANINLEKNASLTVNQVQSFYEDTKGFSVTLGEGATLTTSTGTISAKSVSLGKNSSIIGNVNSSGSLILSNNASITGALTATNVTINSGSTVSGVVKATDTLTLNASSARIADYSKAYSGTMNLNNVGARAVVANIEFGLVENAKVNISLGNNSLAASTRDNAIVFTMYGKTVAESSEINVSLGDFVLGENFKVGEIYEIALICSRYADISSWKDIFNLIDDSSVADFVADSLVWKNNAFWVSVVGTAVPEPSTYAMIFGALALVLAVYRRRK